MAVLDASKVKRSLKKKGFVEENGDHYFYHYLSDCGKKTKAWTKVSHGATDIKDPLIKKMAMQTQLTKEEFGIFEAHYLQGYTEKEIAAGRQKSHAAVRMSCSRMTRKLRDKMGNNSEWAS